MDQFFDVAATGRRRLARVVGPENRLERDLTQSSLVSANRGEQDDKNFSDHSANERTFLAWVRTSIAVMAFGFIVEKFDLFLEVAAPSLAGRAVSIPGQRFGDIAGLALIIIGTVMVAIAAVRFLVTQKHIDSEAVHTGAGSRIDIALAVMLVLVGTALVVYLTHAVVTTR
jgi:putative membrane protein